MAGTRTTVVTERGQTSIPAELRRALQLARGQRLHWERLSERELKVTVLGPEPAQGADSMRGFAKRFRETRTTAEWMEELRAGEDS